MSWDKESDLKHKYTYVDGEQDAAYKKKKRKPAPKKANHKHEYTNVIIEYTYPKNYPVTRLAGKPAKALESYCTICGKIGQPQKDKKALREFGELLQGHYFYTAGLSRQHSEFERYKEWCDKHYPHVYVPDYYENAWRGQVFVNIDSVVPPQE